VGGRGPAGDDALADEPRPEGVVVEMTG